MLRSRIVSLELHASTGGPPCDRRGSAICNLAEVWPDFQVQEGLPLPEPAGSAPASASQNVGISDGHSCGAASFTNHQERVPVLPHGCVRECLPSSLKPQLMSACVCVPVLAVLDALAERGSLSQRGVPAATGTGGQDTILERETQNIKH